MTMLAFVPIVAPPRLRVSLPAPALMDSARSKKANRLSAVSLPVIRAKEEVNGGAVVG